MRKVMILAASLLMAAAALAACGDDDGVSATTAVVTTQASATTEASATSDAPVTTQATGTTEETAPPADTAPPTETGTGTAGDGLALFTSSFEDGDDIPVEFTCDGANDVPEIRWDRVPAGTTSLALTVIDPDGGDWIHWIIWNIPPEAGGLAPDTPAGDLPDGSRQAQNDYAQVFEAGDPFPGGSTIRIDGWDGPCPGPSPHRYFFTLYALTGTIDLPTGTPGLDVLVAIEDARENGSLIGEATLLGMYPAG